MKKIIIIAVCFLFACIPVASGLTISNLKTIQSIVNENKTPELPNNDPPDWATHGFIGVLGVTDAMGKPQKPASIIAGYCQNEFKGKVAGVIAIREGEENIPKGYFAGQINGPFMFGILGNITNEKKTFIVGLGFRNETHFYFRIMALVGPTFYISGKYMPLNSNNDKDLLKIVNYYIK